MLGNLFGRSRSKKEILAGTEYYVSVAMMQALAAIVIYATRCCKDRDHTFSSSDDGMVKFNIGGVACEITTAFPRVDGVFTESDGSLVKFTGHINESMSDGSRVGRLLAILFILIRDDEKVRADLKANLQCAYVMTAIFEARKELVALESMHNEGTKKVAAFAQDMLKKIRGLEETIGAIVGEWKKLSS